MSFRRRDDSLDVRQRIVELLSMGRPDRTGLVPSLILHLRQSASYITSQHWLRVPEIRDGTLTKYGQFVPQ